jgi:NadR type nicotinamide-nucleotide adenylyltransferase
MPFKKIVVIGPESTGKSTLCAQLAEHFKTQWVPEYAREYLLKHGTDYKYEDLYTIAEGQVKGEENIINSMIHPKPSTLNPQPVFIDTDLNVIKVWSEFVFNNCDNRILTGIANRNYDLYLLCNTDLPWVKDELREYPDLETREKLYYYYKETMINQPVPWEEISGNYEERLQKGIGAVNKLL